MVQGQAQSGSVSTVIKGQIPSQINTNPEPVQAGWKWDNNAYILWDNGFYMLLD